MWDACALTKDTKDAPLDAKGVRYKRTGQYTSTHTSLVILRHESD